MSRLRSHLLPVFSYKPLFSLQLHQVSMFWSMKALLWTCPIPTLPSSPRTPTSIKHFPILWRHSLNIPAHRHRRFSSPLSLSRRSPESCPARGSRSPSTWSRLSLAPSPCAQTPLCPSTGPVWKTGMWYCEC